VLVSRRGMCGPLYSGPHPPLGIPRSHEFHATFSPILRTKHRTERGRGEDKYPIPSINKHIRPKPSESTGSRPLSLSQAEERRTSSWVGDDQRIPGVVCFFCPF
jgi:hypothetical protein